MNRHLVAVVLLALPVACGDNINVAPNTPDVTLTTLEDTPLRIELELTDDNGDQVELTIVSEPENGSVDPTQVIYTPAANFNGIDQVTYLASDGALVSTGTITIIVEPVNDAPTISAVVDLSMTRAGALIIPFGVSDIDSPPGELRTAATSADELIVPNANLVLGGEGINRDVTITAIELGEVDITLFVLDEDGVSTEGFRLTVGNAAPTAIADSYDVATGVPLTVLAAGGVLANDSDADGDAFAATAQIAAATTLGGTVTLDADGGFIYDEPVGGLAGQTDFFDYEVTDAGGASVATVSLIVN